MTALVFVIILGLLIFFHELGHFIFAKIAKIPVEEFAIGFPPKLFSFKKAETRYSINLVPVGGYVKLLGETGDSDDHRAFTNKSVWSRLLVIVAGVFMNVILAIILLTIGFCIGMAPLQTNPENLGGVKNNSILITGTIAGGVAQKNGIEQGDQIIAINEQKISNVTQVQEITKNNSGKNIQIEIRRSGQISFKNIKLSNKEAPLGVYLVQVQKVKLGIWDALKTAIIETWLAIVAIASFIWTLIISLVSGGASKEVHSIAGPVGIYNLTSQATKLGISYILQFTAIFSINLAVLNIIPFPALDGGRALFVVLEAIFKRKVVRESVEQIIHTIGFIILILLLLAITVKDIVRLN